MPDLAQHLEAVERGQHHVEHDQVDTTLAEAVEPLAAVADRGHAQPGLFEPERRHLTDRGVVLHEQHVLVHRSSLER